MHRLTDLLVLSNDLLNRRKAARSNFEDFIRYVKGDKYSFTPFHTNLAGDINDFHYNRVIRMMLFAPPQHGKSDQSSRYYPAFELGKNPGKKLVLVCYAKVIAEGFSTDIQNIIASEPYRELFPDTLIDNVGCKKGTLKRNSYEFHTSEGGYLISVGVGGPLTSKTVDIAILDDLYKGPLDAYSPLYRQRVRDWYDKVLETRLHNDSKILLLYTRWHHEDLAGGLLHEEPDVWTQIKYEMVKTKECNNPKDLRELGEALWPERHSKEKAIRWQKMDPIGFESLGQQNPKPARGFLYKEFKEYNLEFVATLMKEGVVKSYTDTADSGSDHLATITFWEYKGKAYVKDIIYTKDAMEDTIPLWAEHTARNQVILSKIEYNNGGHPFKLYAEDKLKLIHKYTRCKIFGFHQTQNKLARILSQSAWVQENVIWPENWHLLWPEACHHLKNYLREGQNDHDDIEDCLTGVAEMVTGGSKKIKAGSSLY